MTYNDNLMFELKLYLVKLLYLKKNCEQEVGRGIFSDICIYHFTGFSFLSSM